ncbi:hypothetical protein QVD17_37178 [Tagetes erecta]|uniref:Glabrous enhancer-binding protein-like DBD domain-containing protein n=1 Tax=Tagetes erecta TaxID=13708 RepID=A0AAD8NJL7_TARER|nr:hypothetical protein QVD17_37178 [Tagetes erecta]
MDFTPPSSSNPPIPIPIQASPISSIPSSQKLPIKRKNPNSSLILTIPNQSTAPSAFSDDDVTDDHDITTVRNPPFKFHRIWSEPDEIRLLQSLLDCSSQGLSFPRDLGIFYSQFCNDMSQPYSKTQLSEKLRRLRKKFRMISSRLDKGLDKSMLSVQDRALYDLSKQLWDPNCSKLTFSGTNSECKPVDDNACKSNLVGVRVRAKSSQTLPCSSTAVLALPSVVQKPYSCDNGEKINKFGGNDFDGSGGYGGDVKVNCDVNVELGRNEVRVKNGGDELSNGIVRFASTTLADVLDRSLKEMRMMIDVQRCLKLEKEISFEKRWRDQHVAEFDVLAKRLKLILEDSSMVSK